MPVHPGSSRILLSHLFPMRSDLTYSYISFTILLSDIQISLILYFNFVLASLSAIVEHPNSALSATLGVYLFPPSFLLATSHCTCSIFLIVSAPHTMSSPPYINAGTPICFHASL